MSNEDTIVVLNESDIIIKSKQTSCVNLDECYVKLDDISIIDPANNTPSKNSKTTVDTVVETKSTIVNNSMSVPNSVQTTNFIEESNTIKCSVNQSNPISFINNNNTFLNQNGEMFYACIASTGNAVQSDQILQLIPQNQLSNYLVSDKEYSALQFMNAATLLSGNQFFNNDLSNFKSPLVQQKQSCNICIVDFPSKRAYLKHMTIHENDREFKCRWCKVSYNYEINLLVHVAIIHPNQCSIENDNDMNYRCLVCSLKFSRKKALQGHCLIHQVDEELLCEHCSASFNSRVLLEMHINDHDDNDDSNKPAAANVLHCKLCDDTFASISDVRRHHKQHHRKEEIVADEDKKVETDGDQNFDPSNKRRTSKIAMETIKLYAQKTVTTDETGESRKRGRPRKSNNLSNDSIKIDNICNVCIRSFKTPILLRRHEVTHTGVKEFECPICNKLFTQKSSVKIHMAVHEAEKAFQCKYCQKSFTYEHNMHTHVRTVHRFETTPQADGNYLTSEFTNNTAEMDSVFKKPRRCRICISLKRQSCHLCRHVNIKTQQRQFKCYFCHRSFHSESVLDTHLKTHLKPKQFVCELCSRSFSLQQTLTIHARWHNGRPMKYRCNDCTKKFTNATNYYSHYATNHANHSKVDEIIYLDSPPMLEGYVLEERTTIIPNRPFKCNQCNKSYKLRRYLRDHLKEHTNSNNRKPCNYCNKTFLTIRSLQQHTRTQHVNRRIFQCTMCPATFILKASLIRHGLVHTTVKPYACPNCLRQFKAKVYCDRHINLQKCHKGSRHQVTTTNGILKLGTNIESEILATEPQLPTTLPSYCNYRLVDLETSDASSFLVNNFVNEFSDKYMVVSLDKDGVPHPGQPAYFVDDRQTGESILGMLEAGMSGNSMELNTIVSYDNNNTEMISQDDTQPEQVYYYQTMPPLEPSPVKGSLVDKFPILKATLFSDDEEETTPNVSYYNDYDDPSTSKFYHGCANCPEKFPDSTTLINHVKQQHPIDKDFTCPICNKAFSVELSLWAHLKIHETIETEDFLTCVACGQKFISVPSLSRHVRMQHNDKLNYYRCTHCQLTYKTTRELDSHIKQLNADYDAIVINSQFVNTDNGDKSRECLVDLQDSEIVQLSSLNAEKTSKLSMQELIKAAREKRGLNKSNRRLKSERIAHENDATTTYPFRCVVCNKGFNRASNLQQHLSVHTKMTPYQCSKCSRKFRHRCSLKTHENTKHSAMTKLLRCHLCQKLLRSQVALRNHMKIHLKNYAARCDTCSTRFTNFDEHEQHKLLNQCGSGKLEVDVDKDAAETASASLRMKCVTCATGFATCAEYENHRCNKVKRRSHQCVLCNETFGSSETLCSHICEVHKLQTKYNCSICNILFIQESLLLNHQKSVHNINNNNQ